jgi:hypothetical protein
MGTSSGQKFYFAIIKTQEMIMVSRWNSQTNKGSKPYERPAFLIYTKFIWLCHRHRKGTTARATIHWIQVVSNQGISSEKTNQHLTLALPRTVCAWPHANAHAHTYLYVQFMS